MEDEIFEVILSQLDYHLIEKVREMRIVHKPYLSMLQLSLLLDLPDSAVSKIENMKKRDRYNIRILNKIAKVFQLKSYGELFPDHIVENDMVRIRLKKRPIKKGKQLTNNDGTVNKVYEVLSIIPLTEKEIVLWNTSKLNYLTIIK